MSTASTDTARGLAPLAGVLLLVLTVGLAAVVSGAVLAGDHTTVGRAESPPRASLSLSIEDDTLALTHRGGDALDVTRLRVVVVVDGEPLAHQPPVPFFSARGFYSGPTGPFNSASDPTWTAGETATLRVAGTNQPTFADGAEVTVRVYAGDALVAEASARAD